MVQVPRLILKEGVLYFLSVSLVICVYRPNLTMTALHLRVMLMFNSTQIISNFVYDLQLTSACIILNL